MRTIAAECPGAPAISVIDGAVGSTARFWLEMTGVERQPNGIFEVNHSRQVSRLRLPDLERGQALNVLHTIIDGECSAPVLMGEAHASSPTAAVLAARTLWLNQDAALQDCGLFRFEPRSAALVPLTPDEFRGTCIELSPAGLEFTANAPVGFAAGETSDIGGAILLPQEPKSPSWWLTSLSDAGRCVRGRLDVSIRFEYFELDNITRDVLAQQHARGCLAGHLRQAGRKHQAVGNPEVLLALDHTLSCWLRQDHMLRVRLSVIADRPPPRYLLQRLGEEFFGTPDFEIRGSDDARTSDVTDLRTVISPYEAAPPLFPDPIALLATGLEHAYSFQPSVLPDNGILLGHVRGRAKRSAVRFQPGDRDRHCYCIGSTGTGKSTQLRNMIAQDIAAGEGICLIDPHGDLYRDVLDSVPDSRLDDVVQIDAEDTERSVGINLLDCGTPPSELQTAFAISEMLNIVYKLYGNNPEYFGPVFEQYFRNTLGLLIHQEGRRGTLAEVLPVLIDKDLRKKLIASCHKREIVDFWTAAERTTHEYSLDNFVPYISSKLTRFVDNPRLRPIISQEGSSICFRKILDNRKILLVNLAKGLLGELDSQLLGMLVLSKLFEAALARTDQKRSDRRPFYLYVDEAQNFVTETMSLMLAESRKFGLHMTLANQTLAQVRGDRNANLLDSLLGNAGTLIAYRLGPIDAREIERHMEPEVNARDLVSLPAYHAATRLLVNGQPTRPFVFRASPPMRIVRGPEEHRLRNERLALCRQQYTRPRADIEREIERRRETLKK